MVHTERSLSNTRQTKSKANTKASSRARKSSDSTTASATRDSTHVIRVNVLGLAGITVNRSHCKDVSTNNKEAPAPPHCMKAVVAFSRGQRIYGTTVLSKSLARSPNDDVVVPKSHNEGEGVSVRIPSGMSKDMEKAHRHVAVWAAQDESTVGSMVSFETTLPKLRKADGSSSFAPQNYELTLALTEDTDSENKVALPFGVTNLNITDDGSLADGPIIMDLPVLSLKEANPLSHDEKVSGKMIAIRPKTAKSDAKKKSGLKRLFGGRDAPITKVPTMTERKGFADTYFPDASGDAILRVQLLIVPRNKVAPKLATVVPPPPPPPPPQVKAVPAEPESTLVTHIVAHTRDYAEPRNEALPTDEGSAVAADSVNFVDDYDSGSDSSHDDDEDSGTGEDTVDTFGDESGTLDDTLDTCDDESTLDTVNTGTVSGSIRNAARGPSGASAYDDEDCTYDQNATRTSAGDGGDLDTAVINVFGRQLRIPTCGPLQVRHTRNGGTRTTLFDDDLTEITADFFGRDIRVPICSAIKPSDDDDETYEDQGASIVSVKTKQKIFNLLGGAHPGGNSNRAQEENSQASKMNKSLADSLDAEDASGVDSRVRRRRTKTKERNGRNEVNSKDTDGSGRQTRIKFRIKGSPKGAMDFAFMTTRSASPSDKGNMSTSSFSERFQQIFSCGPTAVLDTPVQRVHPDVPEMVIPNEDDSVGELTATTYELRVSSEARRFSPSRIKQSSQLLVPAAFGGGGMCGVNMDVVDEREANHRQLDASNRLPSQEKNYFADYGSADFEEANPVMTAPSFGQPRIVEEKKSEIADDKKFDLIEPVGSEVEFTLDESEIVEAHANSPWLPSVVKPSTLVSPRSRSRQFEVMPDNGSDWA